MSVVDEDTELRDLLVQTLDKNGVLGKIKAELRASIFLALEAQDQVKNQSSLTNVKLQNFFSKPDSFACIELIHEFLDFFRLDYTSAVFCPETNTTSTYKSPSSLRQKMNLPEDDDDAMMLPVLASVLKANNKSAGGSQGKLDNSQRERCRSLFSANLNSGSNHMSPSTAVQVLSSLCPRFPLFLIERFVTEESKSHQSEISIHSFTSMYETLYQACHSVITESSDDGDAYSFSMKKPFDGEKSEEQFIKQTTGIPDRAVEPSRNSSMSSPEVTPASPYGHFFDDDYYGKTKDSPVKFADPKPANPSKIPQLKNPPKSNSVSTEKGDWSMKEKSATSEFDKRQVSYEDDFNSSIQTSISEDLQVDSLLSSAHSSAADLTEDRTISEMKDVKADYLEDVRK